LCGGKNVAFAGIRRLEEPQRNSPYLPCPHEPTIRVPVERWPDPLLRSSLARLFGKVMPFWMAGSALLNLILLLPFEHLDKVAWRLSAVAFAIQVFAVLFSLVAPVTD